MNLNKISLILVLTGLGISQQISGAQAYTFTDINDPNSIYNNTYGTFATGINDSGRIIGYYFYNNNDNATSFLGVGFIDNNGTFSDFIEPNESQVPVSFSSTGIVNNNLAYPGLAINDSGTIVGTYDNPTLGYVGFIDNNGTFSDVIDPNNVIDPTSNAFVGLDFANGINNSGTIVGNYYVVSPTNPSSIISVGYIDNNGTFSDVIDPNGVNGTFPLGINNSGTIVGSYLNSSGQSVGFIDNNGTFSDVTDSFSGFTSTSANGINDLGTIVGDYFNSSGQSVGFIDNNGTFSDFIDPANSIVSFGGTFPIAINNSGQIVGSYIRVNDPRTLEYQYVGFVATVPEPSANLGLGTITGLLLLRTVSTAMKRRKLSK